MPTLFPPRTGQPHNGIVAASPDIKHDATKDLYAHGVNIVDHDGWSGAKPKEMRTSAGKEFFANDYVSVVERVERVTTIDNQPLDSADVAVKAVIKIRRRIQRIHSRTCVHHP